MRTFLALTIAISTTVTAKTIELSCPAEIETKQEIISPPGGWDISTSSPTQLDTPPASTSKHRGNVTGFSSGHPKDRAILAPEKTTYSKKNRHLINIWSFSKSEEDWFICSYHNTVFELSKPLPAGLKQCRIQYNDGQTVTRAWCE
ncbi:STY0301 family protein [Chitinimonas sp. PSY-7]|uniref:STY0301 family protein n=1 Tax=Chitinimonas sp. PSY-7 TaxID=3459088 RepID=UPI0040403A82